MTTQTTTTFVGIVGRNENLFRETKSGDSAGGNQTRNKQILVHKSHALFYSYLSLAGLGAAQPQ